MSGIPTPRPRWFRFLRSKRLSTGLTALGSVGGAAFVAYKAFFPADTSAIEEAAWKLLPQDPSLSFSLEKTLSGSGSVASVGALFGLLWVALVSMHAFYVAVTDDAESADRSDPHHLRGPLLLLDVVLRKRRKLGMSGDDQKKFRATLHKVEKGNHIQAVPYVGWQHPGLVDGGVGRRWPNRCGLVGNVIRKDGENRGEPLIAEMPEDVVTLEQYQKVLRDSWGYTMQEACSHAPMRMSSIAVPITSGTKNGATKVIGVLYCDSSERKFFDEEIVELCVLAAQAIADQVRLAS